MGLFDGYFDPEQFNSGGGLLGRLLALRQPDGLYQLDADSGQASSAPQMPSPASMLSPLLPNYGQPPAYWQPSTSNPNPQYAAPWPKPGDQNGAAAIVNPGIGNTPPAQTPVNQQNFAATGYGSDPAALAPPTPAPNAVMAQYVPTRPVGIPLPPMFVPGTPENDAFVHSTINAGRAIGNAVGNILNNDGNENPILDTTPGRETKGRSKIFEKPGGYDDAVGDFNGLNPTNVRPLPNGGLTGTLPDGRSVNVRPGSSDGSRPTIEIIDGKNRIKTRYGDKR